MPRVFFFFFDLKLCHHRSDYILTELLIISHPGPAPPLKLIDLPGLDQRAMDDSVVGSC